MQMSNLVKFAARLASANDCAVPSIGKVSDILFNSGFATSKTLSEVDAWLATLDEYQLETLADGDEYMQAAIENLGPYETHQVIEELFMALCE